MMFDRPIPVADGIFQIRAIGARVTVLVENGEALLVDAGLPGSSAVILRGLKRLGVLPEQLIRVALTHFHPDHAGGLGQLVAGRPVAVSAHSLEADIIEGKAPLPTVMPERPLGDMTQPVVAKLMGRPVPVEQRLEDGDVIPFGTEVRVVHVPGHTEGRIALLMPEKRAVIVGDAAVQAGPPAQPAYHAGPRSSQAGHPVIGEAGGPGLRHDLLQSFSAVAEGVPGGGEAAGGAGWGVTGVVGQVPVDFDQKGCFIEWKTVEYGIR